LDLETLESVREAAERGDSRSQYELAQRYKTGRGVEANQLEAMRWLRKAVEHGHCSAANDLGEYYSRGTLVSKDLNEAAKWYRLSAAQNAASAQARLGNRFSQGDGVTPDIVEAASWYLKAAEQQDELAQLEIGRLYLVGQGISQDFSEAVKWFRSVAKAGYARSATLREARGFLSRMEAEIGIHPIDENRVATDAREGAKWWYREAATRCLARITAHINKLDHQVKQGGNLIKPEMREFHNHFREDMGFGPVLEAPIPSPAPEMGHLQAEPHGKVLLIPTLITIAMLGWALHPENPYGYYILLRFVTCPVLGFLAFFASTKESTTWTWLLGIMAIVYNPIIRVHLNRDVWSFINVATMVMLLAFVAWRPWKLHTNPTQ
jgi:hypothetical protein